MPASGYFIQFSYNVRTDGQLQLTIPSYVLNVVSHTVHAVGIFIWLPMLLLKVSLMNQTGNICICLIKLHSLLCGDTRSDRIGRLILRNESVTSNEVLCIYWFTQAISSHPLQAQLQLQVYVPA